MESWVSQIRAAQGGDLAAYAAIVRQFKDMAFGCAYAVLGDFHLAEDASQDAFVEAYRKLRDLREPKAFPGWFKRIVLKHCDRLTRRSRVIVVPMEQADSVPSPEQTPDLRLEQAEMERLVLATIRSLPEGQRLAATLFYINGYSQSELAGFLDVPVSTVKKRLYDSRQRMKEVLMKTKEIDLLAARALKKHVPDRNFTRRVLERMQAESGAWRQDGEVVSGMYGGKQTEYASRWWGRLITRESWSGDALVVEFDALALSGLDGAKIQTFLYPCPTSEDCGRNGVEVPEFVVEASCFGKYHWSRINFQTFCSKWSRHMARIPADGDFCGVLNRWYHIKAERIGKILRLWVDDVPVYERETETPPPVEVWPVLGADVSHNRFRNLTICRPNEAYIRQHRTPASSVFRPYAMEQSVLAKYPQSIVRTASITLGRGNREEGIREWAGEKGTISTVADEIGGRACRRTDLAAKDEYREYFHFRVDDLGWNRFNEVYLDVDSFDQGGAIAAMHNTWYNQGTPGGDLEMSTDGIWHTHTTRLREVTFRDLGRCGAHIALMPLRTEGRDLHISGVRLREIIRPAEAYEDLLALYNRAAQQHRGEWPEAHYKYAMYRVQKHNLKRHNEADAILRDQIENHPGSECLDAYHIMAAKAR